MVRTAVLGLPSVTPALGELNCTPTVSFDSRSGSRMARPNDAKNRTGSS